MKKFIFLFVMTGLISLDATSYLKPKEREFKEDQWGGYVYADFNYSALSELLPYRFTTSEVQYIDESSDAIKPGFTLGIGAYTPYDNWNFFAEYTFLWFDSDLNRVRIENITTGNIPWVTNGLGSTTFPQYVNGSAEWRMQYNDVIISLKRNYKLTKGISCLLENGVRAIVSKQTLDFTDNLDLAYPGNKESTEIYWCRLASCFRYTVDTWKRHLPLFRPRCIFIELPLEYTKRKYV